MFFALEYVMKKSSKSNLKQFSYIVFLSHNVNPFSYSEASSLSHWCRPVVWAPPTPPCTLPILIYSKSHETFASLLLSMSFCPSPPPPNPPSLSHSPGFSSQLAHFVFPFISLLIVQSVAPHFLLSNGITFCVGMCRSVCKGFCGLHLYISLYEVIFIYIFCIQCCNAYLSAFFYML